MNSTCDCSPKITREHYISGAILGQLTGLRTEGLPGALDKMSSVPVKAMTVSVLCERHNASLNHLDTAAGRAFSELLAARNHLANCNANRKRERHFLVDGYALELWSLKTLAALHHGGIIQFDGAKTLGRLEFETATVIERLWYGRLEAPLGLYLNPVDRDLRATLAFGALAQPNRRKVAGIQLQILDAKYSCLVDVDPEAPFVPPPGTYRPPLAHFSRGYAVSVVHFAWGGLDVGDGVYRESDAKSRALLGF